MTNCMNPKKSFDMHLKGVALRHTECTHPVSRMYHCAHCTGIEKAILD